MSRGERVNEAIRDALGQAVQKAGQALRSHLRGHADALNATCVGVLSSAGEVTDLDNHDYLGSLGFGAKSVLRHVGRNLSKGDIVIANDPYSGTVSLRHVLLLCPVYGASSEPIATLVSQANVPDVGGAVARGRAHGAEELLAEGVRITPVRLRRHGTSDHGLLETILLNSREPEEFRRAIAGMCNAVESVEAVMGKLLGEYGDSPVRAALDQALERAAQKARAFLRAIPDASVTAERRLPGDGTGRADLLVGVMVQKEGDRLTLDFSRTSRQSKRFVNSSFANTWKCAARPFALRLEGSSAVNGGSLRCFDIKAAEGSLVHPRVPAPTGWGIFHPGAEISEAVDEALRSLLGEQADVRRPPPTLTAPPGDYDGLAALLAKQGMTP